MKLIIGLGNPIKKYAKTRHNFGFMAVDFLQKKINAPKFKMNKKLNAEISKTDEIILAKPKTFMNSSGEAVQKILSFYKMPPDEMVVIHDDLDLSFEAIKTSKDSGSAGHNGVQSIIDMLGTKNLTRIRLGINRPPSFAKATDGRPEHIPPEDYVLQNFSPEELNQLPEIFQKISV